MQILRNPSLPRTRPASLRAAKRRGFTLTELMVVILIIGLLVGVVGPKVMDTFFQSQRDIAIGSPSCVSARVSSTEAWS